MSREVDIFKGVYFWSNFPNVIVIRHFPSISNAALLHLLTPNRFSFSPSLSISPSFFHFPFSTPPVFLLLLFCPSLFLLFVTRLLPSLLHPLFFLIFHHHDTITSYPFPFSISVSIHPVPFPYLAPFLTPSPLLSLRSTSYFPLPCRHSTFLFFHSCIFFFFPFLSFPLAITLRGE